jgi:hypothetical protein
MPSVATAAGGILVASKSSSGRHPQAAKRLAARAENFSRTSCKKPRARTISMVSLLNVNEATRQHLWEKKQLVMLPLGA